MQRPEGFKAELPFDSGTDAAKYLREVSAVYITMGTCFVLVFLSPVGATLGAVVLTVLFARYVRPRAERLPVGIGVLGLRFVALALEDRGLSRAFAVLLVVVSASPVVFSLTVLAPVWR